MAIFDLYGSDTIKELPDARKHLEAALGIHFEEHESTHHGGVYFKYGKSPAENFLLKLNLDPFDGEPLEQQYPDALVILYVSDTSRSDEIRAKIERSEASFTLLRHEDLA
jgi:hypothetical protein